MPHLNYKVMEARTDTPAMLEALQAITAFYGHEQGGNTAEARKNLRQVGSRTEACSRQAGRQAARLLLLRRERV